MLLRGQLTIAAGVVALAWLLVGQVSASRAPVVASESAVAAAAPAAAVVGAAGPVDPALLGPPAGRDEFEQLQVVNDGLQRQLPEGEGGLTLRYTFDPELSEAVWTSLRRGRFPLAHVVVMEPHDGRILAYASTDVERFPPNKTYPAASLVKVVTAAATLDRAPQTAREACHFVGSPWRLTRDRLKAPRGGNQADMRKALATSNNQCFARWAIKRVGTNALIDAIDRFGLLIPPAPGHPEGQAQDPGDDELELGQLGSGLDGLQITPLHAAQIAATLVEGELIAPHWIEAAWAPNGERVPLPDGTASRRVLTPELAGQLRSWLVDTTVRGTARRAFRTRAGRPLLAGVPVAGKTGSLNGSDPKGRYEWFIGVAPAEDPKLVVATLAVQGPRWWWTASQLAADVLRSAFCPKGRCNPEAADRFLSPRVSSTAAKPTKSSRAG